jgi:LysR family glycine cleavage system transcriptional activator
MERQLPPLNALRAFDVAARTANFTEAGKRLNVSQGAISRHIAQLEAFLGAKLFQRGHREALLTEDGAEYALVVRAAFDRIEQATQVRLQARWHRPLRIKLFPTLATKWLAPRLGRFHTLHPTIDVQLTTTLNFVHFESDDTDVTIQTLRETAPGVLQEPLFAIELVPVCSPAYLEKSKPIERAGDLLDHTLLHSMKWPADWQTWFAAAGVTPRELRAGLSFGNSVLAYQAAIDGAGIVMAHTQMIGDDIASGRLAVVYPLIAPSGDSYHLTIRQTQAERADMVAFRAWILEEARLAETAFTLDGRPRVELGP